MIKKIVRLPRFNYKRKLFFLFRLLGFKVVVQSGCRLTRRLNIQMFSEFSNYQFLSIIQQFFLSLYFLHYFVAEFIINVVLLIYKTILRLLIEMILAAARVSLVETVLNIET